MDYSDGWIALTLAHLAATGMMVGLMWTIHHVHYPLFRLVGPDHYGEFQQEHMQRISRVLLIPWGTEVVTAGALFVAAPDTELRVLALIGGLGVVAVAGITAVLAAPAHGRLLDGFDERLHRRLLRADAVRTVIWTLRLPLAVWITCCSRASLRGCVAYRPW